MAHYDHFHAHDGGHESPHPKAPAGTTLAGLKAGLALTAGFAVVEAVGGSERNPIGSLVQISMKSKWVARALWCSCGVSLLSGATFDAAAQIARLEILSGDRQIAVNTLMPSAPLQVRAASASGAPIAGANLIIGPSGFNGPWRTDEFGFRGFNARVLQMYCAFGCPPPEHTFTTGANGVAAGTGRYFDFGPASFLYGAVEWNVPNAPQVFASVVAVARTPPGVPAVLVEFFHQPSRHYFVTHLQDEIDAIERGSLPGWQRSIGAFIVYAQQGDAPPGAKPVCRFFSSRFTAHFYTIDAAECEAVKRLWPAEWTFETPEAFWISEPDRASGQCAVGFQPVYRLYIDRDGPSHRYVTDLLLRDRMVASGWTSEGYGSKGTVFCTPA